MILKKKMNLGKTDKKSSQKPLIETPNFKIEISPPEIKNQSKGPIDLKEVRAEIKKKMAPFRRG